jgi:hypothetical protein
MDIELKRGVIVGRKGDEGRWEIERIYIANDAGRGKVVRLRNVRGDEAVYVPEGEVTGIPGYVARTSIEMTSSGVAICMHDESGRKVFVRENNFSMCDGGAICPPETSADIGYVGDTGLGDHMDSLQSVCIDMGFDMLCAKSKRDQETS